MKHSPGFLRVVQDARTRVREVSASEVRTWLEQGRKFLLIDVREDREWQKEHARGARHLGRGILERDIEQAAPDTASEIVLYCGGGYRSALSADSLQKMGYTNVLSMAGGYRAWTEAGGPVEKG